MSEIVALVEGPTEQAFVRDVLAEHLGALGVFIRHRLSGKSGKHGGVKKWHTARNDILRSLKEGCYCTTMFDFYGLPDDWPGRQEAAQLSPRERGSYVEAAIVADLAKHIGTTFDPRQFIPYVQVHEFEALLFADVNTLAADTSALSNWAPTSLARKFKSILEKHEGPEAINDDHKTCPSRRISALVPTYKKAHFGPIIAKHIGLQTLREKCRHFHEWVTKLEMLGNRPL